MLESNMNIFDAKDFKPDNYVRDRVQECIGGPELQQRMTKIQGISDHTASSLKKHVYANYMQFIETAKEISQLESEMYQLSHLLIEQRNILSTLREENAVNDTKEQVVENENANEDKDEIQNNRAIQAIRESVQGLDDDLVGKTFIHEGALIELDSDDHRPICRIYFFLLNDLLIVGKVKYDKSLEFAARYDATKLGVINIKDRDGVRNAINLITADGSKIFQCISPKAKNEWIDKFETALKFNQNTRNTTPMLNKTISPTKFEGKHLSRVSFISDAASSPTSTIAEIDMVHEKLAPDWLLVAGEETQSLIAQRHFEEALALIVKCEEYLRKDKTFHKAAEIAEKIKQTKFNLSGALLFELSNCQRHSLHAALISSRRPLKLLAEMGKAREACSILLKVCTATIQTSQRQARRNNLEISQLFFCDLTLVATEFLKAFSSQNACISTLVVWCNAEIQYFALQLTKHYLTKGSQLEDIARSVASIRKPCAQLKEIGLDLSYHMDGLLRDTLEQIIEESRFRLIDKINRINPVWTPYNLQSKLNVQTTLRELKAVDIDMKQEVTGDTWINLTQSNVHFCLHFMNIAECCGLLGRIESLRKSVEILLKDMFLAQYRVKPSDDISVDLNFVAHNHQYLTDILLPTAIQKYNRTSDGNSDLLSGLLLQIRSPPIPKPRSVYQTDVI